MNCWLIAERETHDKFNSSGHELKRTGMLRFFGCEHFHSRILARRHRTISNRIRPIRETFSRLQFFTCNCEIQRWSRSREKPIDCTELNIRHVRSAENWPNGIAREKVSDHWTGQNGHANKRRSFFLIHWCSRCVKHQLVKRCPQLQLIFILLYSANTYRFLFTALSKST